MPSYKVVALRDCFHGDKYWRTGETGIVSAEIPEAVSKHLEVLGEDEGQPLPVTPEIQARLDQLAAKEAAMDAKLKELAEKEAALDKAEGKAAKAHAKPAAPTE